MVSIDDFDMIALDIDGTVTTSEKHVSAGVKNALVQMAKAGKKIVLASGRPAPGVKRIADEIGLAEIGGYMLCYNGGRIVECSTGKVISSKEVPWKYIRDICADSMESGAIPVTYEGDTVISEDPLNRYAQIEIVINGMEYKAVDDLASFVTWDEPKVLIVGEHEKLVPAEKKLKERFGDSLSIYFSESYFLEVMAPGVDKADSLAELAKMLGTDASRVLAFGDGLNDISMLKRCGISVCMENGCPEAKAAANYITDTNDNDGVAAFLDKIMLKNK